jgi:hypothetical protein
MSNIDSTSKFMSFSGTSLQLFKAQIVVRRNGHLDASKIHSRACYEQWLINRHMSDTELELRKFQRALSNHLAGVDGRSPFLEEEERAILVVLREKKKWPCVPDPLAIGALGFRSQGYHEKQQEETVSAFKKPKVMLKTVKSHLSVPLFHGLAAADRSHPGGAPSLELGLFHPLDVDAAVRAARESNPAISYHFRVICDYANSLDSHASATETFEQWLKERCTAKDSEYARGYHTPSRSV